MPSFVRVVMSAAGALALTLATARCGVGGIGQTTASPVQPTQTSQQQANTGTTTATAGNTTGAVDPGATATTGDAGSATTTAGTTAAEPTTTAGQAGAGATSGTGAGATAPAGGNGNTTTSQDGNEALFDLSKLKQVYCYYDAVKGSFAFSLSNDAQFCAHGAAGVRMMQDHHLTITADVAPQAAGSNANNTNDTTPAQPTRVKATLSVYSANCTLQSSATSLSGSLNLTKADSTGCTGSYILSMEQTMPTPGLTPTTVTGDFTTAPMCATLATSPAPTKCQ